MEVIYGWVQSQPGSTLRDWSTFTTIFPGPNLGWTKVFAVKYCCPNPDPPFEECDVFLNRGEQIVLMRDLGTGEVKATGPSSYTDIAIIGDKLYARKFDGYLDEYLIGATNVEFIGNNIVNIGTGTSLASDGAYLIYDVNSGALSGKIVRASPGVWTPEVYDLPDPVFLQGDLMLVGGNQLAMSTLEAGSSMLIIDNDPVTPTINSNFVIKDNLGVQINNVYGMFQKEGVIFIVTAVGNYYSMSTTWPISFTLEGQILINGDGFGDWNGAAQTAECVTIAPPTSTDGVSFRGAITNNGIGQPGVIVSGGMMDDAIQNEMTAPTLDMSVSNTYNGPTVYNSVGPYRIRFTNSISSDSTLNASIMVDIDGGGYTEIDNQDIIVGEDYDESFALSPTTSVDFLVVITRVVESIGYTVEIHNDEAIPVSGTILTDVSLKGLVDVIIPEYVVDLEDVPPTDSQSGSADFQTVSFRFDVGDIPALDVDIYYKIDGGSEVFVATESIPISSSYLRSFTQPSMALTNFTLIYKFKQPI